MIGPKWTVLAAVLAITGCQTYMDPQGRTHYAISPGQMQRPPTLFGPGTAYVPNESIAAGVATFSDLYRKDGFGTVRGTLLECARRAHPGADITLVSRCFALDVAAFLLSVSQNNVRGTAPPRDLDVPSFRRRFALYQAALGVPVAARQVVEDSVFQRVSATLGSNPP